MFKKNINRSIAGNILLFLFLTIFGLYTALPFMYAISNAFKPLEQLYIFPPPLIVTRPTFEHFIQLGQLVTDFWVPLSRYIFNSVFVSVIATAGHVLFASMAAYPLAKHRFPGREFFSQTVVLALLFTQTVTFIPLYIVMSVLGILNSYAALILPQLMMPLGLYLMQNFMKMLNDSMLEAARIDGAGEFKIYWSVVMPNCKPAWMTLIIFAFQQIWNNNGNLYIYKEQFKVLPAILSSIAASGSGIARAGVSAAATLITLIPPALIFFLSQNFVVETMSTSGLKQ